MGLFGLGLYLNYNNPYLVAPVRIKVQGPENFFDEILTYGTDDKVIADSINYRNIIAGHSLRRLCKHFESEGGKKITIVYGIAHMEPIMEYAQNEHKMELALKTIPLAINNAFGDRSIRLYDYNLAANQWTRRSDIK